MARTPDIWTLKLLYQYNQKDRISKEQANLCTWHYYYTDHVVPNYRPSLTFLQWPSKSTIPLDENNRGTTKVQPVYCLDLWAIKLEPMETVHKPCIGGSPNMQKHSS